MKKTVLSLTLAASVLALGACSSAEDKALVTSKVGEITVAEFNETAKNLVGPAIIQQMITEKVLADKYEVTDKEIKAAYDAIAAQYGDNFKQVLEQSGFTEESYKDSLKFELLQDKAVKDQGIKEEDVKKHYEQMKIELNGRHILVADEATAKEAIEKIKAGTPFADVAKEYSTDPGSAEKGGELGWFTVGSMIDEFNDAAYALELNTVSEPVQSSYGYHVIEITERRDVKDVGTFKEEEDAIRESILAKLKQPAQREQYQLLLKDIIAKMAKDAEIKTDDKDLKDALKMLTTTSEEEAAAAEKAAKEAAEKAEKEAEKAEEEK